MAGEWDPRPKGKAESAHRAEGSCDLRAGGRLINVRELVVTPPGREYLVRFDEMADPVVYAIIRRSPVNARGFYQAETVYRTIKPGSRNYREAVRLARTRDIDASSEAPAR